MRELILFQWLVFFSLTKQSLCVPANADQNALTFFKHGNDLPGPTMSFSKSLNKGIFEFEFKTFVDQALILYQDDNGVTDYIRLAIDAGRLQFSIPTKDMDPWYFTTKIPYNDFQWHSVRIERNENQFKLLLDGELKAEPATRSPTLKSNLLLGGFPKSRLDETNSITERKALNLFRGRFGWRGFFIGCVRNIKYGRNETTLIPVNDIPSLRSHVTKGSCNLSLCDKRRKNKPPGICENQGVCVSSGASPPTCDCRWTGYNGTTCTEDALRLILNGTYKVAYKLRTQAPVVVKQEQFTVRIKTARENAIILLAKDAKESSDKLRLEIKNSMFMVTSETGDDKDQDALRSSEMISDNKWHFVRYRRNGKMLFLTVDENTVNLTSGESDPNTNYDILYIGDINSTPINLTIEMEDFIWEDQNKEINFVKGVYESFGSSNDEYMVIPSGVIPIFNWKLPARNKMMNMSLTTVSTDIDDCKKAGKECHSNAYCSNTEGSHECRCKTGYAGDGIYNCTDIDECNGSPCHGYAQCRNTNGSYTCTCKHGFHGDGHLNCTDTDECSELPAPCLGQCTNTFGSYSCRCSRGFTGDGKHNCTDRDECAESANICGEHALCRNTEGSFSCACDRGYIEKEYGDNCTNIDECAQERSVCHSLATCVNTEGSFTCQCPEKYHGDGVSTCLRNNPCDTVPCFLGLKCSRTSNDSFSCEKCPPFFYGDGINCMRNKSKSVVSKKSELVLTNEKWTDELTDKSSEVYKTLATQLIEKIRKVYEGHPEFVYASIKRFRKGSVVAEFELIFAKDVEDSFKHLQEAISNGHLANMTMETREPVANTDSEKKEILGLNQTIFICVVALASGICILGVTMIIFILIIRRSKRRSAQIYQEKQEENLDATEPQELMLYKTSVEQPNGQCVS